MDAKERAGELRDGETEDRNCSVRLANDSSTRFPSVVGMTPRFEGDIRQLGRGGPADIAWEAVEIDD